MKYCNKCESDKDSSEFTKDKRAKSGLSHQCKSCANMYTKNNSARIKLRMETYRKTDRYKECNRISQTKTIKKFVNAYESRKVFSKAIWNNDLINPSVCQQCQSTESVQGHHCDYNEPLDVMWLCRTCHTDWHKHNEPLNRIHGIFNPPKEK